METRPGAHLAQLLVGAFDAMTDQVVAQLAAEGHPGVTATLEFALSAIDDGAQTASDLGRRLGVSKQAAAKSIATLEQLGYVERLADADDARRKTLQVTERGRDMTTRGARVFDALREQWQAQIGAERVEVVESALAELVATRLP